MLLVLWARVKVEIGETHGPQPVRWKHSLHCKVERMGRTAGQYGPHGLALQATWGTGMGNDALCLELAASEVEMRGVDNNDRIATEDVVKVGWLVFALQDGRDLTRKPPQNLTPRIGQSRYAILRDVVPQPRSSA